MRVGVNTETLNGDFTGGLPLPHAKWHLNRSPSGITIDHDLASILHTFIVCGMLADYPGPSTPRFTVVQTDKCWTNFLATETVRGWAKGVPTRERHPVCKYPDSDVELCRALYDDGMAIPPIAEKMEVPYPTVRSWVQFESRKTTEGTTHG